MGTSTLIRNQVKSQRKFSLFNSILAASRGENPDGLEGEVSAALRAELEGSIPGLQGGVLVHPTSLGIGATRLDTVTPERGPEAIFVTPGTYAPALAPLPIVQRLGATVLTTVRTPQRIIKEIAPPEVHWVGEDPDEDVEESTLSFASEEPPIRTAMSTLSMTKQLDKSASIEIRALTERAVKRAAAVTIDTAALIGTGENDQPRGLIHTNGIGFIEAGVPDGGAPQWEHITGLRRAVADASADFGNTAFLGTPGAREALEQTPELSEDGVRPAWRGSEMAGEVAMTSTILPGNGTKGAGENLHSLVYGAWGALVVQVVAVELLRDPFAQKKSGVLELTLFVHLAVALAHVESFAVIRDIVVPPSGASS